MGNALKLSSNFRSSDGVIDFANGLFSGLMRSDTCGIDYANTSFMRAGGQYPNGYGEAKIHVFGKEVGEENAMEVYSVLNDGRETGHTKEGLAVLDIIEKELKGTQIPQFLQFPPEYMQLLRYFTG